MKKFFEWMEKYFVPIAAKIGSQRHLVAIRDGFVTIMPLIIAGSFAVLINNLPWEAYQNFMNSVLPANWKDFGGVIYDGSFTIMSILIVATISYHLAKGYDKDGVGAAVISIGSFFILYPKTPMQLADNLGFNSNYLGSTGLFIAIIVALVATEIYVRLVGNPKLVIKMPDGVPPAVSRSFAGLLPSIIVLVIAGALRMMFVAIGIDNVFESLFLTIQKPLEGLVGSFGGMLILILFQQLLWFFGIHGSNIIAPIVNAVLLPLTLANTTALQNGQIPQNIVNSQFLDSYVNMGGSGTTIALLIAIFIVGRRSKQEMMIAKLGIAPACFNINEPVIFGMPLVLNPVYFIPFILAPLASASIAYGLTLIGFVPAVSIVANWVTPPILGAVISTGSLTGGLVALICLVVSVLIYIPFVVISSRKALEVEGL